MYYYYLCMSFLKADEVVVVMLRDDLYVHAGNETGYLREPEQLLFLSPDNEIGII